MTPSGPAPASPRGRRSLLARLERAGFTWLMGLPLPVIRRLAGPPVVVDGLTLDPETQWLLRLQRLLREPVPETLPLAEARAAVRRQAQLAGGDQPIGAVQDLVVAGADGDLPARLYVPRSQVTARSAAPAPLLLWIHGGGMMHGDLEAYDPLCRFLAEQADVRVLSLDYRLAPEHRYPAAVEDCWAAYAWVAEHAEDLGADPERLAVGGDSAGGYLAAVVALLAAQAGTPLRHQLLIYPVTDMAGRSRSRHQMGEGFYLTAESMELAEDTYLPPGHDRRDPLVSVLHTEKVPEGLAPATVVTAGFDLLRDEGEAYGWMLRDAGVEVDLRRYPGLIHSFANVVGVGRSARGAMTEIARLLGRALR